MALLGRVVLVGLALTLAGCATHYDNGDRTAGTRRAGGDVVANHLVPYDYGAGKRPK